MARIELNLPQHFPFITYIDVLIQHINAGRHLANEHLLALLNEARVRYMQSLPQAEHVKSRYSFINADLAIIYKSEARHGDTLAIAVAAQDFSRYGCDIVFRVNRVPDGALIAEAKMAMLNFDYSVGKLKAVDEDFARYFSAE